MPFFCFSETGKAGEFTLGNPLVPLLASFLEVVIADAVERHFGSLVANSQVKMVPFTRRSRGVCNLRAGKAYLLLKKLSPIRFHRMIQLVKPTRFLWISAVDIVLDLNFRASLPGILGLLGNVKHHATVAGFRNAVLQRQLKVLIFLGRDQVPGSFLSPREGSIFHGPSIANRLAAIIAPARGRFAVKEHCPAAAAFCFRQLVKRDFGQQWKLQASDDQQCQ